MKKKRTLLCIILALVIALGSVSVVSAEAPVVSVVTERLSNTSGEISVCAEFDEIFSSCSVKVILQEKYNNSWRTATGVPEYTILASYSYNDFILFCRKLTLVKGKVYRIKVVITDKIGTTTTSNTYYGPIF